ncbi:MAG TPA: MarC family protein, partial [Candidatus Acidoferrum sp.]|nr:MarC family protein [Candidatus Acidoferrum sp.]
RMLDWNDYLRMFTGLIAVVGPVSTVPLFLNFTENVQAQRKHIARISAFAVFCIMTVSVLAGNRILHIFNISIEGFRVAGGILLLTIAFDMLQAKTSRTRRTPEEDAEAVNSTEIGVVPLALPLLAGPGAISTVILFSEQSPSIAHKVVLIGLCLVAALVVWVCFHLAPQIGRHLSQTSMNISSRVMGLILAAMAVEFIVDGLKTLLPGLAS